MKVGLRMSNIWSSLSNTIQELLLTASMLKVIKDSLVDKTKNVKLVKLAETKQSSSVLAIDL